MQYRVLIEPDEDGVDVAEVPSLPGCISQGDLGRGVGERQGGDRSLPGESQGPQRAGAAADFGGGVDVIL